MSIEKRNNGYTVRWRDSSGRQRSQQVALWRDAVALDGELKRKRAMGELIAHERGKIRLEDFWEVWWKNYAMPNLTPRTRSGYARLWMRHIKPAFGTSTLTSVTRERVASFVGSLSSALAPASGRQVLAVLQGLLQRAVEWGYIPANPVVGVKKPRLIDQRRGVALLPEQIDALCSELDPRGAAIVRVLAETGLRPGELRGLRWGDIGRAALRVERAVSADVMGPTKTYSTRLVDLNDAARKTLLEWYVAQGQPAPSTLIFPAARGGVWTDNGYRLWMRRVFKPAAARVGLKDVRPYDLRHTRLSRLIADGMDVVSVAAQAGHAPAVTLAHYAHEFKSVRQECAEQHSILEILKPAGGLEPPTP